MPKPLSLKQKIANKQVTLGTWITIGHPSVIDITADTGAFDWLCFDMEHSPMTYETVQTLVTMTQGFGLPAIIRVEDNDMVAIKKSLDTGADGVIVPMINSKEDALKAVEAIYYPPKGKRGVGLSRAQGYGYRFPEYQKRLNKDLVFVALVEHVKAVENIDAILSVKEIDAVIIGPYDLSASMGKAGRYDEPDVKKAMKTITDACVKKGKPLGKHVIEPEGKRVNQAIKDGCTFIGFSLDFFFISQKIRDELPHIGIKK